MQTINAESAGTRRLFSLSMAALAWAAAAALMTVSFATNLERACTLRDTPYLPLCPEQEKDAEQLRSQLSERIQANPGDALAWSRLLVNTRDAQGAGVLKAAAQLAPNHPNVLRRRAAAALQENRMPEAVALLVQMLRSRGTAHAGQALAQIVGAGQGSLLKPHLDAAEHWLPGVLAHMQQLKIPPGAALALVAEALERDTLPDRWVRDYLESLKAAGQWHDAYGLWVVRNKGTAPLLYNSAFDQPLQAGGFDWESHQGNRARAGASVEQNRLAKRGQVLAIEFTGRSFVVPIVRQYIFAAADHYILTGEYMASKVRSEAGLVWKVACPTRRGNAAAQSMPLQDTGGRWRAFEFRFSVPTDCGPVASLQLEPAAAYEGAVGIRGNFVFDAFSLAAGAGKP